MVWGKNETEIADALNKAKASGDLKIGDRFSGKVWSYPTQLPPPRWVSLDEVSHEELVILAGRQAKTEGSDISCLNLARYSDAELSSFYANGLPSLV